MAIGVLSHQETKYSRAILPYNTTKPQVKFWNSMYFRICDKDFPRPKLQDVEAHGERGNSNPYTLDLGTIQR
jgi:hypothetical protein